MGVSVTTSSIKCFVFPTMQQISEDLLKVLDHFKVKLVVGLGEGAGANILVRFGMANPDRCYGLVLVHCTSTTAGVMEHFKDKQLDTAENKERLIKEYQDRLQSKIMQNLRNMLKLIKRTDLTPKLENMLKVETLLLTGAKSAHVQTVHQMHQACNKSKASLLKIDDVGDVLVERPEKFAQSLLLFCKGLGVLTSLPMTGVERQRTFSGSSTDEEGRPRRHRAMSMEEYDIPNLRRFSFSNSVQTAN
ncbi:hypothetical protein Avbf_02262 [Armadillidium vulgare]|nr:hypothetical protein Avbf_02262 [Armadillidium vulgare]